MIGPTQTITAMLLQLKLEEDVERQRLEAEGQEPQPVAGRLSFRRVADLNRLACAFHDVFC